MDYGYVKEGIEEVKYFENCLTWNIDGSILKPVFRKGKFSLSEKVIPLIIRDRYKNYFDYDFLIFEIEKEIAKKDFSFNHKAGKGRIKGIKLKIPLTENEEIDVQKQKEIAKTHLDFENINKKIDIELNKLLKFFTSPNSPLEIYTLLLNIYKY